MKLRYGLFVLVNVLSVANADGNMSGIYTLPPSKVYIEPCQREALHQHPGIIEKLRILDRQGNFWIRHQILAKDGSESAVLCDLANGEMIGEQQLINDGI